MTHPQSQLARCQPKAVISDFEMHSFALKCWQERGIPVFLSLDQIPGGFERQAIIAAAEKLYGKRHDF